MMIREMSKEKCLQVLAATRLARLGCARDNQPYVVPVCLAFDAASDCLYGFTIPGQKVEWMRANPLVCVEVDEIVAYDQWVSVIAFGRCEELSETSSSDSAHLWAPERPRLVGEAVPLWSVDSRHRQCVDERERAWQVLSTCPMWWEPAWADRPVRAQGDTAQPLISIYYRIRIDRVTGRGATRDARNAISYAAPPPPVGRWGSLLKAIKRVFAGRSTESGSPA